MTGAQHYREAETLITATQRRVANNPRNELLHTTARRSELLAEAQVHATLALAAAQALRGHEGLPSRDRKAWFDVAATPEPAKAVA